MMEKTLADAQDAANQKRAKVYVFRSVNLNGHESSWFNFTGVKTTPNAELHAVLKPQADIG
jgi:hypothetical protein